MSDVDGNKEGTLAMTTGEHEERRRTTRPFDLVSLGISTSCRNSFLLFCFVLLLQIVCPYICRLWHPPEEEDTAEALLLGEAINL